MSLNECREPRTRSERPRPDDLLELVERAGLVERRAPRRRGCPPSSSPPAPLVIGPPRLGRRLRPPSSIADASRWCTLRDDAGPRDVDLRARARPPDGAARPGAPGARPSRPLADRSRRVRAPASGSASRASPPDRRSNPCATSTGAATRSPRPCRPRRCPDHVFPHLFGEIVAAAMLPAWTASPTTWRPDLVIHDAGELAAPIAAARIGVPAVTHGFGALTPEHRVAAASEFVAPAVALGRARAAAVRRPLRLALSRHLPAQPPHGGHGHVPRRQSMRPVAFDDAGDAPRRADRRARVPIPSSTSLSGPWPAIARRCASRSRRSRPTRPGARDGRAGRRPGGARSAAATTSASSAMCRRRASCPSARASCRTRVPARSSRHWPRASPSSASHTPPTSS